MPQSEGGYKLFKIGELFDVDATWIYGKNKQYNTREQKPKEGFIPVVSGITVNNGINYYTNDELLPDEIFADSLTISTRGEYSGTVTYHDGVFGLANNILVMVTPQTWSRNAKLYLGTLISKLGYGGYNGYPRKETLKKDEISLPVNKQGDIDFEAIEQYMQELELKRVRKIESYIEAAGFNDCSLTSQEKQALEKLSTGGLRTKAIKLSSLFSIKKGKRLTKADMIEGDINFIGATSQNNGITAKISNDKYLHPENTITVTYNGSVGEAFYQVDPFWASDDVNVLYPKFSLNESLAIYFLAPLIKKGRAYGYAYKWTKDKMESDSIQLPVTADGSIDYAFMENYINAIKKQTIARVKEYIDSEYKTEEATIEPTITPLHIHDTYQAGRIPLYTLRAACGYFDDGQLPEAEGWIDATGLGFTPDKDRYFAVHAKGDSMLPKIHDGDICIFEWYHAGSRNGEIVLSQSSEYDDAYGGRYTIKRYYSEKTVTDEGWQHAKVELQPLNPDFEPIVIDENDDVRTIGIFKCVLD